MNWFNSINSTLAIIGSTVTILATLAGVWISISKYKKESNIESLELIHNAKETKEALLKLNEEIKEIKEQNKLQQTDIELSINFSKSYFRMTLFNSITKALQRGFTTIGEATEVTRMYSIYIQYGGNGEIELLFNKFDKLEIRGDDFYETK